MSSRKTTKRYSQMVDDEQILNYEIGQGLKDGGQDLTQFNNMVEYVRELMNDYNISEDIQQQFFGILTKHHMLSNLGDEDIKRARIEFDFAMETYKMTIPPHKFTFELENELAQIRMVFQSLINRGKEGFERKSHNEQIQQRIISTPTGYGLEQKPQGVLSKIKKGVLG